MGIYQKILAGKAYTLKRLIRTSCMALLHYSTASYKVEYIQGHAGCQVLISSAASLDCVFECSYGATVLIAGCVSGSFLESL